MTDPTLPLAAENPENVPTSVGTYRNRFGSFLSIRPDGSIHHHPFTPFPVASRLGRERTIADPTTVAALQYGAPYEPRATLPLPHPSTGGGGLPAAVLQIALDRAHAGFSPSALVAATLAVLTWQPERQNGLSPSTPHAVNLDAFPFLTEPRTSTGSRHALPPADEQPGEPVPVELLSDPEQLAADLVHLVAEQRAQNTTGVTSATLELVTDRVDGEQWQTIATAAGILLHRITELERDLDVHRDARAYLRQAVSLNPDTDPTF